MRYRVTAGKMLSAGRLLCEDIDHAERMRQVLVNLNPQHVKENRKYIMRITGDEQEGKAAYAARRPEWARHKAGCAMLSCSS